MLRGENGASQSEVVVTREFVEIIFCRGGILRGWRIAGKAIRHSWMRWGRGRGLAAAAAVAASEFQSAGAG